MKEKKSQHKVAHQTRIEGRVQTVNQGWDGSLIVRVREQNKLFVDEVIVGEVPSLSSIQVLLKINKTNNSKINTHTSISFKNYTDKTLKIYFSTEISFINCLHIYLQIYLLK